jgi:nitroreductase
MLEHIAEILEAARVAPSRDNLQPWRFHVDGDTVSFAVDAERDRSPMNAGERMARIAVGAALESALIRAGRMGSTIRFREPRPGALVTVSFIGSKRVPELDKGLARRATNRHEYDGRAADDETFTVLRDASPALETVRAHWFGRERVRVLAAIVEDATAILHGNAQTRAAFLSATRFDARDREEVSYGLSTGSLELSAAERVTLESFRRSPEDVLAATGAFKKLASHERRLIESASGLCLISATGDEPIVDVNVGRTLQRAWLALTRRGLVAQPIAAIAALEAMLTLDDKATLGAAEIERAGAVRDALRAAVPSLEKNARVAIALRFGWTGATTAKVGRRPLPESVNDSGSVVTSSLAPPGPSSLPPPASPQEPPSPPPSGPPSEPPSRT